MTQAESADVTVALPRAGARVETQAAARPRSRRAVLVVLVLAIAAGVVVWRTWFASTVPDSVIALSGRIEGDDAAVAPKLGGRILELRVREGDSVKEGDIIAVL